MKRQAVDVTLVLVALLAFIGALTVITGFMFLLKWAIHFILSFIH